MLHEAAEGFSDGEVLLPLEVLLDPNAKVRPHHRERAARIRQIEAHKGKLSMQDVITLIEKLRTLILQDYFLERFYDRPEGRNQETQETPGGTDG